MLREPAACGRRFLDHKVSRGRQLWPAPLAGDDGSKSCFPVERHQCALQVGDDRLHLDDEQGTGLPVPRQNVD